MSPQGTTAHPGFGPLPQLSHIDGLDDGAQPRKCRGID